MKMRNKPLTFIVLSALILMNLMNLINMVSCSKKANQDVTPHEITQAVIHTLGINPEHIDDEYYSEAEDEYYFLTDMDMITQYPPDGETVYTTDMFEQYSVVKYQQAVDETFEIGVFKTPQGDGDKLKAVEEMCRARIAKIKKDIFEYNEEKAYYADNARVEIIGNYIYYVICENADEAYKAIEIELTKRK